jgi:hypothetical protein
MQRVGALGVLLTAALLMIDYPPPQRLTAMRAATYSIDMEQYKPQTVR